MPKAKPQMESAPDAAVMIDLVPLPVPRVALKKKKPAGKKASPPVKIRKTS
jgi:hypothetical protein